MRNPGTNKIIFHSILWLIILISFFQFSEMYFPFLNSDMAVNVLMAPSLSPLSDLYIWGQNHAGSLLPMLAKPLIVAYRFPPVLAVAVVHYLLLILGYFSLSTLFKTKSLKIVLALFWFLPAWHFTDHLTTSAGIQLSVLCAGIFFLNLSLSVRSELIRLIWLSVTCILFIASVWISDIAAFSLLLIAFITIWRLLPLFRRGHLGDFLRQKEISRRMIVTLLFVIVGIGFIIFAKHRAAHITAGTFTSEVLLNSMMAPVNALLNIFLFRTGNFPESLFLWLMIISVPWLIMVSRRKRDLAPFLRKNKWLLFFALNAILMFIILIFYRHIILHDIKGNWYSTIFISMITALLLLIENTGSVVRSQRIAVLILLAVTGALSSLWPMYFPSRLPSSVKVASQLETLVSAGIISDYDHSYVMAAADPRRIHATPHDSDRVRNPQLVKDVFKQSRIFIVKNNWLSAFPDTIRQFQKLLVRSDKPFTLAGLDMCRYQIYQDIQAYGLDRMKYQGNPEDDSISVSGKSIGISSNFDHSKHFVYGPFVPLRKGFIKVEYRLKAGQNLSTDAAAILEITSDYGKKFLGKRIIHWCEFENLYHFQTFDLTVKVPQDIKGAEFRILYLGKYELWFDQVTVTGI